MLPASLENYLKLTKSQNINFVDLIVPLKQQGWDEATIEQARVWYENTNNVSPSSPPNLQPVEPHQFATTVDATPVVFAKSAPTAGMVIGNSSSNQDRPGGGGKKILLALVLLIGLSMVTLTVLSLITYQKVKIGNPQLLQAVSELVMAIPFMPRTPEFVIKKSLNAQNDVNKFHVDASVAITSPDLAQVYPGGKFDLAIKGPVDFTSPDNPSLSLNIALSKDFDLDLMLKEKTAYFRINQLPSMLGVILSAYGMDQSFIDQFLKKWFYYESKELETEARKNLNSSDYNKSLTKRTINAFLEAITDEKYGSTLAISDDEVDSFKTHKIHLSASKKTIDEIQKSFSNEVLKETDVPTTGASKLSDYIKNLNIDYWIDKNNYYVRKISMTFVIITPENNARLMPSGTLGVNTYSPVQSLGVPKEIPVAIVIHMTKFGEPVSIVPPQDAVNFEEFLKNVYAQMYSNRNSPNATNALDQFARENNTKRSSDINAILNAINQYMADNKGKIPSGITDQVQIIQTGQADICNSLVPVYIAALPVDPTISGGFDGSVQNCSTQYNTGYTVALFGTGSNRITVAAPLAENGQQISVTR